MKVKYYMRGIGIGIVVTASILSIVFSTKDKTMSKDEIIEMAREYGMVMEDEVGVNLDAIKNKETPSETPSITPVASESITNAVTKPASEPVTDEVTESVPENVIEPTVEEENLIEQTNENNQSDTEVSTDKSETTEYAVVEITSGMKASMFAELVYKAGLVKDARAFNQYMMENDYTGKLRVGTYQIKIGSSFEEIVLTAMKMK